MATRRYMADPQEVAYQVTEAAGAATASKRIELTVDWDTLATDGLGNQQARLLVIAALMSMAEYIEQTGKLNVKA